MDNEAKSSKSGKWILLAVVALTIYTILNLKPVSQEPVSQEPVTGVTASQNELSRSYIENEDAVDAAAIDEVKRNTAWTPKTQYEEDLLEFRTNAEIEFINNKRIERDAAELSKQSRFSSNGLALHTMDYLERFAKESAATAANLSLQVELPEIAAADEVAIPPLTEETVNK